MKVSYTSGGRADFANKNFHLAADINVLRTPFDVGRLGQKVSAVPA